MMIWVTGHNEQHLMIKAKQQKLQSVFMRTGKKNK
jgi:hypothetical protein